MVTVNGGERSLRAGGTLADLAVLVGVTGDEPGVAAALDGEVVPRARWRVTALRDGAVVEIVRAAAGG